MARGKPFSRYLKRLVRADVISKPAWMDVVEVTRPSFRPVSATKTLRIDYPEDRLRNIFLQKNRFARRIPVNLKADTVRDRHLADRFVEVQIKLMGQNKLGESGAYDTAMNVMKSGFHERQYTEIEGLHGSLSDQNVTNEAARLYLASLRDSKKDKALYQALKKQAREENPEACTSP